MKENFFEEMSYDIMWEGHTQFTLFGESYEVKIGIEDEEEEGITEIQRNSYLSLINDTNNVIAKIENRVFQYYKRICEFEPERIDANVIGKLPDISNVEDMKKIVQPITLCIPELEDDEEISILFDCAWDFELGMGVKIVNSEVVCVGVQNDVL